MPRPSLPAVDWNWVASNAYLARSVIDWVALLVLLFVTSLMGLGQFGYRQQFRLGDPTIQHPYAEHERVPDALLAILSMLIPFVGVLLLSVAHTRPWARMNSAALGLLLTLSLTGALTNLLKSWVGRPRPDLLDRCKPHTVPVLDPHVYHSEYVDDSICTVPRHSFVLDDGFRSFPSGHSSSSFAGLVYLALCIRAALISVVHRVTSSYAYTAAPTDGAGEDSVETNRRLPPPDDPITPVAFSVVLPLIPVAVAAYVAVSRVMDYRHHPTDVLAGATLGTAIALVVYRATHKH